MIEGFGSVYVQKKKQRIKIMEGSHHGNLITGVQISLFDFVYTWHNFFFFRPGSVELVSSGLFPSNDLDYRAR